MRVGNNPVKNRIKTSGYIKKRVSSAMKRKMDEVGWGHAGKRSCKEGKPSRRATLKKNQAIGKKKKGMWKS